MLPYQTIPQKENGIAIVGIGGAGANILQCFSGSSADNVRLCTLSLDERVGRACGSNVQFIQLGDGLNHGLGSGGDPEIGRLAAQESRPRMEELLQDVRLLVLVAGLGGGTGSGAAPVIAEMAREAGLFLVSVVLMPFRFEGRRRREQAEKALEEVSRLSDIVYCFENDYMEELFRNRPGARAVFEEVDRLLAKATASVPMLASSPGLINLGLDELATALANNDSRCLFGSGSGYGPRRAENAAQAALDSPLMSYHDAIRFARTVIVHIAGGDTMSLTEIRQAMEVVRSGLADDDVRIFFGTTVKPHLGDEMRVTLIASIDAGEFKAMIDTPPAPPVRVAASPQEEEENMSRYAEEKPDAKAAEETGEREEDDAPFPSHAGEEPLSGEEDAAAGEDEWDADGEELASSDEEREPEAVEEEKEEGRMQEEEPASLRQGALPIGHAGPQQAAGASHPQQGDVETRLRHLFPDDDLSPAPRKPRISAPDNPELEARVRSLFPEDDEAAPLPRPRAASPSSKLRNNDLRDIFDS